MITLRSLKRATWCRLFHRWRPNRYRGGKIRTTCEACREEW